MDSGLKRRMEHPLVALGLLGTCIVLGGLLYLPYFLWSRRRKPGGHRPSANVRYTRTGWCLACIQLVTGFGGLLFGDANPATSLGKFIHSPAGALKWLACCMVVFGAVAGMLRRAGLPVEQPAMPPTAQGEQPAQAAPRRRTFHLLTLGEVPIFVRWSYPLGGLFIALLAGGGFEAGVSYCLAYATLFALHEGAHAAVALALGVRVHSIELSGIGGLCRINVPRRTSHAGLVFAAGLSAQALLLALTLAWVAVAGPPASPSGVAIVNTFTWLNVVIILLNIVPGKTADGVPNDGAVLWGLYRHVFRGAAHPLAAQHAASPLFDPATSLLRHAELVPAGFRTGIELLNDDTTPMAFVVQMLEQHAGLGRDAAIAAMVDIHRRGGLLLALPSGAAADAVAGAITQAARAQGHALVCRAVSLDA